jgi:hypothetical protein
MSSNEIIKIKAKIIRPISRNSFAVELLEDYSCGPIEVQCSNIEAGDRRNFNDVVKSVDKNYKEFLISIGEVSEKEEREEKKRKIDESEKNNYSINQKGINVDLKLGNYCLSNKCWVGCTLYYYLEEEK